MAEQKNEFPYPTVVYLEAVAMANGEILHYGQSLGFMNKSQIELLEEGANKITRGSEPVVALGKNIA